MKAKTISSKGVLGSVANLPKEYSEKLNESLLHQAKRVYEDRTHTGLSMVKTRAVINKTKKKWYKQKGTGGARHGAKSAPIFVGGGVAHGPKGVKRTLLLPSKMRKLALVQAISQSFLKEKAILVAGLGRVEKTSDAAKSVNALKETLKIKDSTRILVVLSKESYKNSRFFKNIKNLSVVVFNSLNAYRLISSGYIFFEEEVFAGKKIVGRAKPKTKSKKQ